MKQQTHLTPDEVIELQGLGVEFEETADIWVRAITDYGADNFDKEWERMPNKAFIEKAYSFYSKPHEHLETLPAPNLQEILGVLPKYIPELNIVEPSKTYRLHITYCDNGEWYLDYYNCSKNEFISEESDSRSVNPLLVAFELLIWVANNYPETLYKQRRS